MRYVIANKKKAEAAGFGMFGRNAVGRSSVVLNEKEITVSSRLTGATLEDRAKELSGRVVSHNEITNILNNNKKRKKA